ncbi:hypothetical protein KY331_05070 [Candidatus Woesearchaeota archaeon]|nr:hypothetical protein [Candidatus Woesearchaeota archaeon]
MAEIEHVKKVDDLIKLKLVMVSCTNKDGLVSNKTKDGSVIEGVPENGLLGFILEKNPDVKFISTGGTYKLLKSAGLPVIQVSELTKYPEMKTGLVKSLHPAIHAGLLAHKYTESDDEFMKQQGLRYIDALIVNFYALDEMMQDENASFEMIRQSIDVGGPSMSHNARKAFISTALITDPSNYKDLIEELEKNNGAISLATRLALAKKASKMITEYLLSVDKAIQKTEMKDLEKSYEIK